MIDGVAFARRRVTFLGKNPDVAIFQSVRAALELGSFAAEHFQIPRECGLWIRRPQMHVVKAERFGVLQHFDFGAPGVFNEAKLEQAGNVVRRRDDLDAGGLKFRIFSSRFANEIPM
jgi:hypothetical protein